MGGGGVMAVASGQFSVASGAKDFQEADFGARNFGQSGEPMKVWKIPPEQLEKLDLWRARVLRFKIHGFALVEKLTGIVPVSLCKSGNFSFLPPSGAELPPWFTQPSEPYGLVSPKRNSKKGKALWEAWKQAKIEPITTIHLFMFLGIELPAGRFSYGLNEIGGEVYLTDHEGWNPEDYGYEPVEI